MIDGAGSSLLLATAVAVAAAVPWIMLDGWMERWITPQTPRPPPPRAASKDGWWVQNGEEKVIDDATAAAFMSRGVGRAGGGLLLALV